MKSSKILKSADYLLAVLVVVLFITNIPFAFGFVTMILTPILCFVSLIGFVLFVFLRKYYELVTFSLLTLTIALCLSPFISFAVRGWQEQLAQKALLEFINNAMYQDPLPALYVVEPYSKAELVKLRNQQPKECEVSFIDNLLGSFDITVTCQDSVHDFTLSRQSTYQPWAISIH